MNLEKIGLFIKELRIKNKMSQKKLAEMIPIDRTVISRWENGELLPSLDKMKILCELLDVSIEELLSGEKSNDDNKKTHQKNLFDFLLNKESKYIKTKKCFIIVSIILIFVTILFLIYYFFQTYNTEKIYRIYTLSDDYTIKNGVLVTTRETSFLKIGSINEKNYNITIYYKENNNDIVIFNGDSDSLIIDFYGYGNVINSKNISKLKDNLYLKIEENEIKLYLNEYYKNDNLIIKDSDDSYNIENNQDINIHNEIPVKIINEFICDENFCSKLLGEIKFDYSIEEKIIYLKDQDVKVQYDILNHSFDLNSPRNSFFINDNKFICYSNSCEGYEKLYNKYYTEMIKKYIE